MTAADFAIGLAALIGLLLPGWLVARALRVVQPIVAGFILSTVGFTGVVIGLQMAGIGLARGPLLITWLVVTVGAVVGGRGAFRRDIRDPRDERDRRDGGDAANHAVEPAAKSRGSWLLFLPLVPAFGVVVYRACAQPLSGIDTVFRWNYLAEQMAARATLDFYPPVTAADYEIYAWPDGIPPAISSIYLAVYRLAGATRPGLTAPVVIFQFVVLLVAVHALARRSFSARAAAFACALLAASPVVLWSASMGQESALVAIAVIGMLFYLPRENESHPGGALVAGFAAGLGALTREYALVLPLLGLILCAVRRLPPRLGIMFTVAAAGTAAPWYVRNWWRTGNPLFDLALGDLFPVNHVHQWLEQSFALEFGWDHLPASAGAVFLTNCGVTLLLGTLGAVFYFRSARSMMLTLLVWIALWVASVGYTAAGFMYGLRVLSPALAIAVILGGALLARWLPGDRHLAGATLAVSLLAIDAALRALTLPANVYRLPLTAWLNVGNGVHEYHARPIYAEFVRVAGTKRILVLGPNALLTSRGARTVPLWSPEVRFLFDPIPPGEIARRLLDANIGFALLNRGVVNERFLARSPFFQEPGGTLQPVWSDDDMILLVIVASVRN